MLRTRSSIDYANLFYFMVCDTNEQSNADLKQFPFWSHDNFSLLFYVTKVDLTFSFVIFIFFTKPLVLEEANNVY